jgi:hypothetical protein
MAFRRELRHPGLEALRASADELAVREGWREVPPDAWIPAPDAAAFGLPAGPAPRRPPSGH